MKRLLVLVISLVILAIIYGTIDLQRLVQTFQQCDRTWLAISLAMVIPQTVLTAVRFQYLVPNGARISLGEGNRLILAACTLNLFLPSKMGDLVKAYFMMDRGHLEGPLALSLVVFERACDLLSLLLWCAFGLLLYPSKDWLFWVMTGSVLLGLVFLCFLIGSRSFAMGCFSAIERGLRQQRFKRWSKLLLPPILNLQRAWGTMHHFFWSDRRRLIHVSSLSLFIWFLHLLQIWFFVLTLRASVPFVTNLALSSLSILAGLLPLTFAGVGTRDAAIIAFYHPYMNSYTGAALGLLCTLRYLIPAIAGMPFLGHYIALLRVKRNG